MLSTRGAITTNVALVECAAGQNKADKNVFLLSELEKVWVSVALVARRLLVDGHAVQISPFGALWLEEYVLLHDRQQRPYTTRKLCFGINQTYANRYGVDTSKVPLERRSGSGYVRVSMADLVAVCGVPARTAAAALKEFFLYLGEGLSRGRTFHLTLPGVATLVMKQQKVVLTMNEELRHALYDIDSRKWAAELKAEGMQVLEDLAATPASGAASLQSSRPSTSRQSRVSWRPAPEPAVEGVESKKTVFVAAAPSGRTFDEIAHATEQRRSAAQQAAAVEREMRRRQEDLDRRIEHYYAYGEHERVYEDEYDAAGAQHRHHHHADPTQDEVDYYGDHRHPDGCEGTVAVNDGGRQFSLRPPSASGESIYHVLAGDDAFSPTLDQQYGRQQRPHAPSPHVRQHENSEPEVEVIEMAEDEDEREGRNASGSAEAERRPLAHKDAELERVLREEEPFTRPISRRTYHETCAARDLIYSQPYEAPERKTGAAAAAAGPSPIYRPSHHADCAVDSRDGNARDAAREKNEVRQEREEVNVPPPRGQQQQAQSKEETFRFGRKRFGGNHYSDDHVGSLLQYNS